MLIVCILLAFGASVYADSVDGDWRIVDGTISQQGQWPWQVSLKMWGRHNCGGSIIDQTTILTAAHCFGKSKYPNAWKVQVGSNFNNHNNNNLYTVKAIRIHQNYKGANIGNDIAIMKLASPIQYSSAVKAISLPSSSNDVVPVGSNCFVSGWGSTGSFNPVDLRHAQVKVVTNQHCAQRLAKYRPKIGNYNVCAGSHDRRNACFGDSGGPFVCQNSRGWILRGVVSWGDNPCGQIGQPTVYTRVSHYLNWITQNKN